MSHVTGFEKKLLCSIPFFAGLPESDMEGFTRAVHGRRYRKGEYIYHYGDMADRFYVTLEGWIRLFRENIDGDEAVCELLTKGDIFGEGLIYYQNNRFIYSAQAAEDLYVFEIPAAILKNYADGNPEILKRITASVCERMMKLQMENERLATMTTAQRVSCLLLRLSSHMIGAGGVFTFPYDKSLAAMQLGMKRETFSRALASLKSLGVTVIGPEIGISNFRRLAEFSCRQCALVSEQCAGARLLSPGNRRDLVWTNTAPVRQAGLYN